MPDGVFRMNSLFMIHGTEFALRPGVVIEKNFEGDINGRRKQYGE